MALIPFQSRIIADTGISMGDEGKGRLIHEVVHEITEATGNPRAVGMVLKVNGGSNSGHTAAGLKLNLLPCGVAEPAVETLGIGAGVVADPRKFWWELRPLEVENRHDILGRLLIDERTMVSDLTHRLLDLGWEHYRSRILGQEARGSTGRGISPAFTDETAHNQLFYQIFRGSKDTFADRMRERATRALATLKHVCRLTDSAWYHAFDVLTEAETRANQASLNLRLFDRSEFDFRIFADPDQPFVLDVDTLIDVYWQAGSALSVTIGDVRERTMNLLNEGRYIIGEFGQSFWLDKRHGFSPNVTASHTFTPEFFQSAGVPVQGIHNIGVCKAYDTKVGTHHFITEMEETEPLALRLKKLEFGTSTGRQRMVGWFDAVEKGDALRFGGCEDIMINKIDVLGHGDDWKGELKLCVAYKDDAGNSITHVPRDDAVRCRLKPQYITLPSWTEDLSSCRKWTDLPESPQVYVAVMMKSMIDIATRFGQSPIPLPNLRYLGVGPGPRQIIKDLPYTETLLDLASKVMPMLKSENASIRRSLSARGDSC